MLREYNETVACIVLRKGDKVIYNDTSIGIIKNINLVPNGVKHPNLIAQLEVKFDNGGGVIATAEKFKPVIGELYLDY